MQACECHRAANAQSALKPGSRTLCCRIRFVVSVVLRPPSLEAAEGSSSIAATGSRGGAWIETEVVGGGPVRRRLWIVEEKRRIVEQTLSSDLSVATVARQHGVNANQVFYWRKLYRAGQLGDNEQNGQVEGVRLLPVSVSDEEPSRAEPEQHKSTTSAVTINIEIPSRAPRSTESKRRSRSVRLTNAARFARRERGLCWTTCDDGLNEPSHSWRRSPRLLQPSTMRWGSGTRLHATSTMAALNWIT
jgi:transposase